MILKHGVRKNNTDLPTSPTKTTAAATATATDQYMQATGLLYLVVVVEVGGGLVEGQDAAAHAERLCQGQPNHHARLPTRTTNRAQRVELGYSSGRTVMFPALKTTQY